MTHPLIDSRLEGGVCTLTLLPQPEGGVQIDFIEALAQQFVDLGTPSEVRVVWLRGDLALDLDLDHWHAVTQSQPARAHRALQQVQRWRTLQLKTLPPALIAVVDGPCRGAALALIEGCDFALATPESVFALSAAQATWLGPQTEAAFDESPQAQQRSLAHALMPHPLHGEQAQDRGWITFCLPTDALPAKLAELTQSVLDKDPLAVQFAKETLAHVPHMGWDSSVSYTAAKFAEIKARQAERGGPSSRATAIAGFLAGHTKPGLKA